MSERSVNIIYLSLWKEETHDLVKFVFPLELTVDEGEPDSIDPYGEILTYNDESLRRYVDEFGYEIYSYYDFEFYNGKLNYKI